MEDLPSTSRTSSIQGSTQILGETKLSKGDAFQKTISDWGEAFKNYEQSSKATVLLSLSEKISSMEDSFKKLKGSGIKAFFFRKLGSEKQLRQAKQEYEMLQFAYNIGGKVEKTDDGYKLTFQSPDRGGVETREIKLSKDKKTVTSSLTVGGETKTTKYDSMKTALQDLVTRDKHVKRILAATVMSLSTEVSFQEGVFQRIDSSGNPYSMKIGLNDDMQVVLYQRGVDVEHQYIVEGNRVSHQQIDQRENQ